MPPNFATYLPEYMASYHEDCPTGAQYHEKLKI